MSDPIRPLTVGVVTKNRPESLQRCLDSLALFADLIADVIVVDDTSLPPARDTLQALPASIADRVTFVRQESHEGYIVARNAIMRAARTDAVLLMDDDACVLDAGSMKAILGVMEADPRVAAVACAMATADGSPWEPGTQPSPVAYACYVPSFIGFAHLLRRRVFLALGGYRESFRYYGEEKDYCRRLLAAGHDVVYVPAARVAHLPDAAGRDMARYLRYVVRNDCLCALYNDPFPLMLATVPMRLAAYFRMRSGWQVHDPGGFRWVLGELAVALPAVLRGRTPMTFADVRRWRELRRVWPPYRPPVTA